MSSCFRMFASSPLGPSLHDVHDVHDVHPCQMTKGTFKGTGAGTAGARTSMKTMTSHAKAATKQSVQCNQYHERISCTSTEDGLQRLPNLSDLGRTIMPSILPSVSFSLFSLRPRVSLDARTQAQMHVWTSSLSADPSGQMGVGQRGASQGRSQIAEQRL